MSDLPTAAQLAEWGDLAETATPGPWTSEGERIYGPGGRRVASVALGARADPDTVLATAAFLAAARTALPALLAEVRRLRSERDRIGHGLGDMCNILLEQIAEDSAKRDGGCES
jgi:hypothetical protein